MPTTAVIIVAAGSSRRMGFDKLRAELQGKSVLQRTLEAFDQCQGVDSIVLVGEAGREDELRAQCQAWNICGISHIVAGGAERHLSVWNGIAAIGESADLIAVHDGGRPLISPHQIQRCIDEADRSGAAASARRITETVKRATPEGIVSSSVDREGLWTMETPQVFRRSILVRAYEKVIQEHLTVTDEVSAVEYLDKPSITLVENDTPNPKITFPSDLKLASQLLLSPPPSSEPTTTPT